ncbi:YiiX family permuted papain-like enzyme [Hymenobacter busanensis]|uniref:YiiX family permuted papain-like enzyme n=1 Tax=Hymenobacter busanensis TaxID=2607656 RepID=A0A7L5A0D4_9BACT|nr:YiiX family permuted papain-like enzyme [Hymenobacter busanensis]KAA9332472.1 YiiX family permuted papain-like enzyme [Hymenobacter busanensis]QHJ07190.1 YiiX family permuted papain-like enzyme [Hymenobacter busanensis]
MRRPLSIVLAVLFIVLAVWACPRRKKRPGYFKRAQRAELTTLLVSLKLREGDLIFHTSQSAQSRAIQLATHSPYSHCGLLFRQGGEWQVLEAVQPVGITPLEVWIARGQGKYFVVKRLRDAETVLTPRTLRRLLRAGHRYRGRPYDPYFGWSDKRMYCSELLWKVYYGTTGRRLGRLQKLRELDLSHPAVQRKMRERYGNRLPLDEPLISPAQMFNSPELVTVMTR